MKKYCESIDIDYLLSEYKDRPIDAIVTDFKGGILMNDIEIREHLEALLKIGVKIIPMSPCNNFDYFGDGCEGHIIPDDDRPF